VLRANRTLRIQTAREDLEARTQLASARVSAIKRFRSESMADTMAANRELKVWRNRMVSRAHERLARERNKTKAGDERSLRLEALKVTFGCLAFGSIRCMRQQSPVF
jgi:hypothetical protein